MEASSSTAEVAERVRVQPGAVPRVEPVLDDVARLAVGRQRDDRRQGLLERRTGGEHRAVGRLDAVLDLADAHPEQDAVVEGGEGAPARLALTVERHPVPPAQHGAVDDVARVEAGTEVRAGAGTGQGRPVGVAPEHDLATGDRAEQGAAGRHVGGRGGDQPAVGGAAQRRAQRGLDAGRLGLPPGAAQVVGSRLGEVAHRHAVAHLFAPGPVGAQQAHAATLTPQGPASQILRRRAPPAPEIPHVRGCCRSPAGDNSPHVRGSA